MADQNGGFSAGGVSGATYDTSKFTLPDGVFKINNNFYQSSQGPNPTLTPINPQEAAARFGTVTPIDQVKQLAPETTAADLQKLGLSMPGMTDATNVPNTSTYSDYLNTTSKVGGAPVNPAPGYNGVNTSQPSPQTVQASTTPGSSTNQQIPSKYEQGSIKATAAGLQSPTSNAQGISMVQDYANPTKTNPQADITLQRDQAYQQYLNDFTASQNSLNQGASLTQMYQSFAQQLGIPALDTKMMNLQNLIDGNEDALKQEIQAAGGTATAQQIQAMANARNKQNIANYNMLVNQRNNAQSQLTAMVGLAEKDRDYAMQKIDRQLDFDRQQIEYADKFAQHAQETFDRNLKAIGWTGILQSTQNDPSEVALVERLYGMPPGGLQIAADKEAKALAQAQLENQMSLQGKQLDLQLKQQQINTEKAQQSKIYNSLSPSSGGSSTATLTSDGKPLTQAQTVAKGYYDRSLEADKTINELGSQFTGLMSYITQYAPNAFKSADRQRYEQAERDFVNAVLRPESGASISPAEFNSAIYQYFPQPGDNAAVIQQKATNRQIKIASLALQSGQNLSQNLSTNTADLRSKYNY